MGPIRELLQDLDSLPYPAWDLFPIEEVYFPNSQKLYSEEANKKNENSHYTHNVQVLRIS